MPKPSKELISDLHAFSEKLELLVELSLSQSREKTCQHPALTPIPAANILPKTVPYAGPTYQSAKAKETLSHITKNTQPDVLSVESAMEHYEQPATYGEPMDCSTRAEGRTLLPKLSGQEPGMSATSPPDLMEGSSSTTTPFTLFDAEPPAVVAGRLHEQSAQRPRPRQEEMAAAVNWGKAGSGSNHGPTNSFGAYPKVAGLGTNLGANVGPILPVDSLITQMMIKFEFEAVLSIFY